MHDIVDRIIEGNRDQRDNWEQDIDHKENNRKTEKTLY